MVDKLLRLYIKLCIFLGVGIFVLTILKNIFGCG